MSGSIIMSPDSRYPDLLSVLESRGYRATAPRKAIARLLEQKEGGFTAEEVSDELPAVGRATVYRTIKLFLEAGVICKLPLLEGAHLYLLCGVGHHHHSVCVECGEVEELRAAAVERLISAVSADIRGEIVEHRLELYVNCGACPDTGDSTLLN